EEPDENLYSAAYEDVTYQDTTDDDEDAMIAGTAPPDEFALEELSEDLEQRLRFLGTLARLWLVAARFDARSTAAERNSLLAVWLEQARANQPRLLELLRTIHSVKVPEPSGSFDSVVEYDQRRAIKEQLLYTTINTCMETILAIGGLQGAMGDMVVTAESRRLADSPAGLPADGGT